MEVLKSKGYPVKRPSGSSCAKVWSLGVAAALLLFGACGTKAEEIRHVEVMSSLGQVCDTAVAVDDTTTFGFSIPRGTALPRRMYPIRSLGVPMIQWFERPEYREVLLRHPKRNHTEYPVPNQEVEQQDDSSGTSDFGLEGDVNPRSGLGNGVVSVTDWVQVGRFVAGLDLASAGLEFQRADCAPRSTRGDGRLTVSDWVQAGRYAAGLDAATGTAGPVSPALVPTLAVASVEALAAKQATNHETMSTSAPPKHTIANPLSVSRSPQKQSP